MGFHICHLCGSMEQQPGHRFPPTSSGDTVLLFENGHAYTIPDMILHYVFDHGWQPPEVFVNDVLYNNLVPMRHLGRCGPVPEQVGYLEGMITTGDIPEGFVDRLEAYMKAADDSGQRMQTRGL